MDNNLRDHMANERTFLAWVRTSIGIMIFGFVVEKFSIFIKEIATFIGKTTITAATISPSLQNYSAILGIILVALGTVICLLAFLNFKKVTEQINNATYQPSTLL